MNTYSTHPSQNQDGKEDAFRKATADVFEEDTPRTDKKLIEIAQSL